MTLCPHCKKRLLSQASACCNWCGEAIDDAQYQASAEVQREAYYAHMAAHDAQSLAATEAIWLGNGNVNRDPFAASLSPRRPLLIVPEASAAVTTEAENAPSEPFPDEAEQAGERFRHLEI